MLSLFRKLRLQHFGQSSLFPPYLENDINRILTYDAIQPHPPEPEWYGMAAVVRQFLELPSDFPLRINIQHGIHFNEDTPLEFYRYGTGPLFVNRQALKELYETNFGRDAFVFGCAQIWYRRLYSIQKSDIAVGTLAFPAHSSHHVHSIFDFEKYAEFLSSLPRKFQPVSICMYWKDLLLHRHIPFVKRGMRIYTAGHLFDPNFIAQLYSIMSKFKFTTGNDVGSHLIYSIEMGIPYFQAGNAASYEEKTPGDPSALHPNDGKILDRLLSLLPTYRDDVAISPELGSFIAYLHGCSENIDRKCLKIAVVQSYKALSA